MMGKRCTDILPKGRILYFGERGKKNSEDENF